MTFRQHMIEEILYLRNVIYNFDTIFMSTTYIHTHLSVDCVVFGFDDNGLNILLIRRENAGKADLKLPGSLIYFEEDVDRAANRVLFELTGIKKMTLKQFRCFSSPERTNKSEDIKWLSKEYQSNIDRLITIAYLSLCKIDRKLNNMSVFEKAEWCPLSQIPQMPFDHNEIVRESLDEIKRWIEYEPSIVFELLPSKFIFRQLHYLYEAVYNRAIDIRNFYKKMTSIPYLVPLDEKQANVPHRAARYYKFDKKIYNKFKANM